jgi:hypothetical protein
MWRHSRNKAAAGEIGSLMLPALIHSIQMFYQPAICHAARSTVYRLSNP